ncbi:MAG: ATP-binding protein [Planctomycetota bacterium]|nr:ATP-binding protein [Planctomycetota bacterium]
MAADRPQSDKRVLLLAPTARDGETTVRLLASTGIACFVCRSMDGLCEQALVGAAAVIVPEEVVLSDQSNHLAERLKQQPVWSDLPVIVLSHTGAESPAVEKAMATLGNVSLIERPMRVSTLLSVVRAALRARERQYQVRDHLEERRLAEAAINSAKDEAERSLTQWRAVIESMTEGLVLADASGNLLSMNPAALAIHEFASMHDMFRRISDYPDLFELRDLDGALLALENWPISRVLKGERFSAYEVQVHRRDTGKTWIGTYGGTPVLDPSGQVTIAVLTVRDITDQKRAEGALAESEERFRQLAETIPQLAWMAGSDGAIFWYNRRWYDYTGKTLAQMEGWGWQSVHDPAHLPSVMERWQRSIQTGDPFEMEFPLKGADGRFRSFLTRIAPLHDGDGRIALWFGTNTDIEDRRRHAEERTRLLDAERAAREDAERASRMKDEFLATLSHELRTPLNAILGWSQILADGPKDEEDLSEGLRTIERNARAQTQIIEDLLDMSRIISGKVRLDVQRIDLAAVVRSAIETTRPAAEGKGIRLGAVLDPSAGPVSGDPNRLQQVMWNLLTNAIKFTPRGGRVHVVLERVNSHLELSVTDTGEGIAPEFLPHVFDRFRQADASTTRRHGGLGLGLNIVKQLVELHGGSIRAKSLGVGHGSTFSVSLPLTVVHPEPEPAVERRHPQMTTGAAVASLFDEPCILLKGVKVLVVDDEPDARGLLRRVLEDCEAVVSTADSADDAMRRLTEDPPDVLLSDIGMPGEDGYSLIRRVRALDAEKGGNIPAVALTAYARAEDRVKSVLSGFQMHIAKPVEPAEVIAMVASLARRR